MPKKPYYKGKKRHYSKKKKEDPPVATRETASSKKLHAAAAAAATAAASSSQTTDHLVTGYGIIDIALLADFMQAIPCKKCKQQNDYTVREKRVGLSFSLHLKCNACQAEMVLSNCKHDNLNTRFALSLFSMGCHHKQGKRFLANMDMPPSVSFEALRKIRKKIGSATACVARQSMAQAARELSNAVNGDEVTVSCDGSWQKRGYSSKNGVATVLSVNPQGPAKVLDTQVLSNHCDACAKARKKHSGKEFQDWYDGHKSQCQRNHEGSAGSMEPAGMLQIFQRSEETHQLKYVGYLGDGDSKSFRTVQTAEPPVYKDAQITKLECCGHVQKRMGRKLMDVVASYKNKRFSEGRKTFQGLGGKAGLTQKAIKNIQGHYGAAIRENVGNVAAMKKAVMAIWKHRRKDHSDCGDWCPSKHGDMKKANQHAFPEFVTQSILPVFEELASDELLSKCEHGGTQNPNESLLNLHNLIWSRCPKTTFVGRERLEAAVHDAVVVFNDGECGRIKIFQKLSLKCGTNLKRGFQRLDEGRVQASLVVSTAEAKAVRRKKKRSTAAREEGEPSYKAGSGSY